MRLAQCGNDLWLCLWAFWLLIETNINKANRVWNFADARMARHQSAVDNCSSLHFAGPSTCFGARQPSAADRMFQFACDGLWVAAPIGWIRWLDRMGRSAMSHRWECPRHSGVVVIAMGLLMADATVQRSAMLPAVAVSADAMVQPAATGVGRPAYRVLHASLLALVILAVLRDRIGCYLLVYSTCLKALAMAAYLLCV